MARLLLVLVVLIAGVVALGFYRDWFHVGTAKDDQKMNITVTVDRDKIREDEEKAKAKAHELGEKVKEKTGQLTGNGKKEPPKP